MRFTALPLPLPLFAVLAALATGAPAAAQSTCTQPAGVAPIGSGTPGAGGLLQLSVEGAPVPGLPFAARVSGGAPGAFGLLVIGFTEDAFPLPQFGATLYVQGPFAVVMYLLDGAGEASGLTALEPVPPELCGICLLYTSPSPRDQRGSRMPSSA